MYAAELKEKNKTVDCCPRATGSGMHINKMFVVCCARTTEKGDAGVWATKWILIILCISWQWFCARKCTRAARKTVFSRASGIEAPVKVECCVPVSLHWHATDQVIYGWCNLQSEDQVAVYLMARLGTSIGHADHEKCASRSSFNGFCRALIAPHHTECRSLADQIITRLIIWN